MLRGFANHEIQQLHNDPCQHQSHQKALGLIPEPRRQLLRGELKLALQPKPVIVKAQAQQFADEEQEEQINKNGQSVAAKSLTQGKIAQPFRPTCDQQKNQESGADGKIGDTQPAVDPVITARLRRVVWSRSWASGESHCALESIALLPGQMWRFEQVKTVPYPVLLTKLSAAARISSTNSGDAASA